MVFFFSTTIFFLTPSWQQMLHAVQSSNEFIVAQLAGTRRAEIVILMVSHILGEVAPHMRSCSTCFVSFFVAQDQSIWKA